MWYNISIQNVVDDESYDFFFKIKDIVSTIEHKSGVSLRKVKKGVNNMIDYEERLERQLNERFAEAKERFEREAKAVGMVEVTKDMNRSLTYDKIIETLARKYNWDAELASKMHEHFDNK